MLTAEVTYQAVISEFLTGIVSELQTYLSDNNRNATGSSSASIQVANVTDNGGQIVGSQSIQWVFTGRGPGGFPPISRIIDWLNARGLPRSMAWVVARKIAEEGTKLYQQGGRNDNGLTQTITQEKIDEFCKNISVLLAVEVQSDIIGAFK